MSIASVGLCVYQQPGISYQQLFKSHTSCCCSV